MGRKVNALELVHLFLLLAQINFHFWLFVFIKIPLFFKFFILTGLAKKK